MSIFTAALAVMFWIVGWWLVIDLCHGLYRDAKVAVPKFVRNMRKWWNSR